MYPSPWKCGQTIRVIVVIIIICAELSSHHGLHMLACRPKHSRSFPPRSTSVLLRIPKFRVHNESTAGNFPGQRAAIVRCRCCACACALGALFAVIDLIFAHVSRRMHTMQEKLNRDNKYQNRLIERSVFSDLFMLIGALVSVGGFGFQ